MSSVVEQAIEEIRRKSQKRLYQTDFQAWKADVLGYRTYEKMQHIGDTALFGEIPRTVIKSANGTSKSFEVAAMIGWVGSVFEPGETVSIISAPSIPQLEKVIFAYLKSNYSRAADRYNREIKNAAKFPGWIDESLSWNYQGNGGKVSLAFGRRPPQGSDPVSVFQGVRSMHGKTYVFFDEAGGMAREMFTAAEAVMTGSDSRFVGIGNPDNSGTFFEDIWRLDKFKNEYNRFTISAFDLPTLTGEVVYPDDPAMERQMLKSLTSASWVEHKKRVWGEKDARYKAKVEGEFPGTAGNAFFGQENIDKAWDTQIQVTPEMRPILGVDVARYGQDESVVYSNFGGNVRLLDSWGQLSTVDSARRIHKLAVEADAALVRIDAAGVGGGVFDDLDQLDEFFPRNYDIEAVNGGERSPDPAQWANMRAYSHDSLRGQMREGMIDLDIEDDELREQLSIVTYKFNQRGAIQITPKDDMKTEMGGSPDRLDALIYATFDTQQLMAYQSGAKTGEVFREEPETFFYREYESEVLYAPEMPY